MLLRSAARSLSGAQSAAGLRELLLTSGARAAVATTSPHAWDSTLPNALHQSLGLAGFATDDGPPHKGEREQSGEIAAQDLQQLGRELATSEALSADDPADAASAAASPEARAQPGGAAATDAQAAVAAATADPDVAAQLRGQSSDSDGGESDGDAFEPVDIEKLLAASESDGADELAALSGSDEDEDEDDADALGAGSRKSRRKGAEAEEGVLATAGRRLTMLEEIQQASKKRQRFLLQQWLSGRNEAGERLRDELRPPQTGDFSMKVVDVNRTSKGARAGRVQGFSALVVVGNQNGILGQGSGKALEAKAAVDKATRKALKHLTYVPRFREHTIHYPITVLYGKTKLIMYPRASARGIKASNLMNSLCRLAGVKDVGIKIQGSRNLRNSVQALFKAFDQMQTRVDEDSVDATPYPELPSKYRMAAPVPPVIEGFEGFDWDSLVAGEETKDGARMAATA